MSKEIYISSTPHETRLAIVENDDLREIYYERENEYTLAGSIYNGKVTRVLPGMQSAFVDIGLERDAFLYVTDFMEEQGDSEEFDSADAAPQKSEHGGRERGRGRDRRERRGPGDELPAVSVDSPYGELPPGEETAASVEEEGTGEGGARRWRGRRGRRRGSREPREGEAQVSAEPEFVESDDQVAPELMGAADEGYVEAPLGEEAPPEERPRRERGERRRGGRRDDRGGGRGRRDRGDRAPRSEGYGYIADSDDVSDAPAGEPIVLPGEKLRKYNPEAFPIEEFQESAAPAEQKPVEEFVAVGWDGGLVLPGETIRPRGPRADDAGESHTEERSGHREERGRRERGGRDRGRGRRDGRGRGRREERGATSHAELVAAPTIEEEQVETFAAPADEAQASHGVNENVQHFVAETEAPVFEEEFEEVIESPEPESAAGFAGAEREAEIAAEPQVAENEIDAAAETAPQTESAQAPQEYEPQEGESASARKDAPRSGFLRWRERRAAAKAEKEAAARKAAEEQATREHDFTTMQPTGEMISREGSELPQHDLPSPAAPIAHEGAVQSVPLAEAQTTPFHFGEGTIEEEEIEGDEFHLDHVHAHAQDDDDFETEEETLEGDSHLGVFAHDIDHIDEDDDDLDEAEAAREEAEGEEGERATSTREPRRRGGRRDDRRGGGRDRRSGGRGRSRQSMQTQDLPAINELLKPGQEILVQIAKEPIAKKGARITSHIALPGRFLVFMPTVNHTGVSRKISSDDERRRLKSILLSEKGDATGGFIVRTAAEGASEEELRSDLRFLINLWNDIKSRSESSKSPALIYHDLNLVERILRDQVTDNFSAIWVDTEAEYERVLRFLQRFQPSLVRRVKLYTKETPLFEQFGISQEIDKALKSKVWLKSGGSIVINQTEALVAIDINTGKYVGKTARLEDTIVKTNLDAIPEIVRQIRLRDLGGIIVIDFIDMDDRKNRHKVLAALEEELKTDRAPSKVLQFNDFGLVAITRKRVRQSLERTLSTPCAVCSGTGMVKSPLTVANEIYVEMRKMYRHIEKDDMMLRVHPDVVKQLKADGSRWLHDMEEMTRKTILVKSDPALSPEQFDIH
ncbi:MAG: Rne/Rng family ribonuclease [Acidobacteria bacterium]|nr:Rne/Rng family ribonuclease [Acidobacteriota bacterium]